jgi:dolichol-phosphate mannosyltransferase
MMGMSESAASLIEAPTSARGAPTLTVVVPCYNERPNVAPLIARLEPPLGIAWEGVYVDDNSPDGTAAEVRRIAQADRRVRCIRRIGRRGLASAVIEGALSSSAQYVAVIDGDLQHDETKLPDMLAALRSGQHDVAVGSRHGRAPTMPARQALAPYVRTAASDWRSSSCRTGSPIP